MQFLKNNYDKVLLAVVIILALGILAFLPILVSQDKKKLDDLLSQVIDKPPKPLPPLDLTKADALLKRAQSTVSLDLANGHKLFNPVRWQMKADHSVFPNPAGKEIEKLEITKISPLYEVYSFTGASVTAGLPTHYGIGITHEAAAAAAQRSVKVTYAAMNQTTNNFTVVSAEGPDEDPTSVTLEFSDTHEKVSISKDKPYRRVEGYIADLRYPPENNKPFLNRRKTDSTLIYFAGESYKIIDIKESEVVLLQQSNQKQWIKELNPISSAPASNVN